MSLFQLDRAYANTIIRVREAALSPVPSSGLVHNLDGNSAPMLRITGPSSDFTLTGIVAPADTVKNATCWLWNATSVKMALAPEHTGSTAANRFSNARILNPGEVIELYYSATTSHWCAVGEDLLSTANVWSARQDVQSDLVVGPTGLLADSATSGFLHLSATDGPPTGSPTPDTGKIPVVFDTQTWSFWFKDAAHSSIFNPHRGFRPYGFPGGSTQTLDFNFDAATITLNGGTTTFITANKVTGRRMIFEINCVVSSTSLVSSASLVWPLGWRWLNGSAPSTIAAGKSALLELWSWTNADSGIFARWNVQP